MSNFDTDNFEKLLKDRSDEFKMYPTKRVWYSIYNNIHPGKKWPSIATCITLISILLLVGYLNTNTHTENINLTKSVNNPIITKPGNHLLSSDFSSYNTTPFLHFSPLSSSSPFLYLSADKNVLYLNEEAISNKYKKYTISAEPITLISKLTVPINNLSKNINNASPDLQNTKSQPLNQSSTATIPEYGNNLIELLTIENNASSSLKIKVDGEDLKNNTIYITAEPDLTYTTPADEKLETNELNSLSAATKLNAATNKKDKEENKQNQVINKKISIKESHQLSDAEKGWVENYALYNRPIPKKWLGKLGWQIYITPSIVYRTLKNTLPNEQDINNSIIQKPSIGLEIGGGIISTVLKSVKLKTGLQLNFTQYNSEAFENSHPVATSITMNTFIGQYQESRSTPYSNSDGISPVKLHNETFQVSIPMGMDIKIASLDNLQWSVGATIQPSYVIGGKSYLISSDKRNYIKESSLLNRWNLDAGFETFISYKTNGLTLQFGPQFRKQLFTTNDKNYFIQEHLTNYGFKFGISKLIR